MPRLQKGLSNLPRRLCPEVVQRAARPRAHMWTLDLTVTQCLSLVAPETLCSPGCSFSLQYEGYKATCITGLRAWEKWPECYGSGKKKLYFPKNFTHLSSVIHQQDIWIYTHIYSPVSVIHCNVTLARGKPGLRIESYSPLSPQCPTQHLIYSKWSTSNAWSHRNTMRGKRSHYTSHRTQMKEEKYVRADAKCQGEENSEEMS